MGINSISTFLKLQIKTLISNLLFLSRVILHCVTGTDLCFKMKFGQLNPPKCCLLTTSSSNNHTRMHYVFGCRVLWAGFNSDSLPILRSLSSGRAGKMVKKVCPCNQLCSNYLSFWSFLPPSIPLFHPCICSPMLSPAL